MFDDELERCRQQFQGITSRIIIAPHIDFRVGLSSYTPVYAALSCSEIERVIILATSHYAADPLFIPTMMHFSTPLGTLCSDTEFLAELYRRLQFPVMTYDWAHNEEHSIEFEALWLQHVFQGRDITIVPILVASFWRYILQGIRPSEDDYFMEFITTLRELANETEKKTAWIVSGDLAHVGRRFDDPFDAASVLSAVQLEDAALLQCITRGDAEGFYECIAGSKDRRKICGLAPVYSMLQAVQPKAGTVADYQIWHDEVAGSAVSFAGVWF